MSNSSGEKSENPQRGSCRKPEKGDIPRSKDVTMAAGLVTSFILLSLFLPYYKALVSQSFVSVAQLASQLDDQGALEQFLLANLFIFAKFLATLIPIPLFSMLATLIPGGGISPR